MLAEDGQTARFSELLFMGPGLWLWLWLLALPLAYAWVGKLCVGFRETIDSLSLACSQPSLCSGFGLRPGLLRLQLDNFWGQAQAC